MTPFPHDDTMVMVHGIHLDQLMKARMETQTSPVNAVVFSNKLRSRLVLIHSTGNDLDP